MGISRKLTEEEVQDRLASYANSRNPKIRDEVVLQYSNLVESIGRRFVGACEPLEDLVQEGYIGLIASVDKYDTDKGVKFSTYATHFIIGQIKHYLRDKGKIIKEPAWLQELNQKMTRVIESLHQKHNRQPTEKEIAEVMQMPESTIREMLTTREVFKVSSLDGGSDRDDDSPSPIDTEKIKDDKLVTFQLPLEDKIVLETAFDRLKDIEQNVISDHFYVGLNQTEIAKKMGISCNYVSHILRNGTKKLKKILATDEIRDSQIQAANVVRRGPMAETDVSGSVLDPVTGVYNQEYFSQRLDEEISRAFRGGYQISIMLLDVVFPESVDQYMRMIRMDDWLYSIGQTVHDNVRKLDVVGRVSDTCFGLILPHISNNTQAVADRMSTLVESLEINSGVRGQKISAGVQIAVAKYPKNARNGRKLIEFAAEKLGTSLYYNTQPAETLDKAA